MSGGNLKEFIRKNHDHIGRQDLYVIRVALGIDGWCDQFLEKFVQRAYARRCPLSGLSWCGRTCVMGKLHCKYNATDQQGVWLRAEEVGTGVQSICCK